MHLLVTNDFPPKVGGIQNYLWELWRRLPSDSFAVITTPYDGSDIFDRSQSYKIRRYNRFWLTATRHSRRFITEAIGDYKPDFVVIDPAFPLGYLGPDLGCKYVLMVHGAEAVIPAKIAPTRQMLRRAVSDARLVITSSKYAMAVVKEELALEPESVYIPPGVDIERFKPLSEVEKQSVRKNFGLPEDCPLIVSVSRLVRRKGFDTLIRAAKKLQNRHPDLQVVIAGTGRDEQRLRSLAARVEAPIHFIGHVNNDELPQLYACCDLATMLCRDQWNGFEQEGFGIVFLEAQAAGAPVIAGRSGGSVEAVDDGVSGFVVETADIDEVVEKMDLVLSNDEHRKRLSYQARQNALRFSYDLLAQDLKRTFETLKT